MVMTETLTENIGCGYSRFTYNKDQVLKLYELLDSHQWNGMHCMSNTHLGDIFDIKAETVPFIATLIEKICAARVLVGRYPELVWESIIPKSESCSCS
jgi:hypothetical protein